MTILLTCLTENVVYQVSDRRLTDISSCRVIDDESNKAVLVDGRVVFTYTGLAKINNERTDLWLAKAIGEGRTDHDMAKVAERIREKANSAFRLLTIPVEYRHQAFQGVGWFQIEGESWLSPGIITIHNSMDSQTGKWLSTPLKDFQVHSFFPKSLPSGLFIGSLGVNPTDPEKRAMVRFVKRAVRHPRAGTGAILQSLMMAVRWLSGRHQRIGPGLMAVSLPRAAVENMARTGNMMIPAGTPSALSPTFMYATATGVAHYYGPNFVMGGFVASDFEGGSL